MDTSDQASVGVGEADTSPRRMRTNEEKRRIVEEALVPRWRPWPAGMV
jgi:hypothetical protein